MCDKANSSTGCDIIDELESTIADLEEERAYLLAQVVQLKSDCDHYVELIP